VIECGRCGGAVNVEHVRTYRNPQGRVWRVRVYCEHCGTLAEVRYPVNAPPVVRRITDPKVIDRFRAALPQGVGA